MKIVVSVLTICLAFLISTAANAHPYKHHHHHQAHRVLKFHNVAEGLGYGLIQVMKSAPHEQRASGPSSMPSYEYSSWTDEPPHVTDARHERKMAYSRHGYRSTPQRSMGGDPRPHAWCGWQMRQWFGVVDKAFNLAANWAHFGSNAGRPQPGTIVVWRHHVGMVVAQGSGGRWLVKSGNDGHAVRERERSLAGAIAFRWPNGRYASVH
jgi:hypothetical protein